MTEQSRPVGSLNQPALVRRVGRRAFLAGSLALLADISLPRQARAASVPGSTPGSRTFPVEQYRHPLDRDDTACIARALDAARAAGGGAVIAAAHRVYRVSPATTFVSLNPSGGTCRYRVCLQIGPGVTLDMQGSSLQLQGTTEATILANANVTGAGRRDSQLGLVNAVIDGNRIPFSYHSLLLLAYIDGLTLRSVAVLRGVRQGAWIYDCSACGLDDLVADDFVGQPWTIGSPLGANQVRDSQVGRLQASNIRPLDGETHPGNSFDLCLLRCSIASIGATNCSAGIKLQWPSADVTIGSVTTDACGDASGNSGLKLQGDPRFGPVSRVNVGTVVARRQTGPGLFMEYSRDCIVGSFSGGGNNINGNSGDVWIGGINDQIGVVSSHACGGNAVLVRPYARGYHVGEVIAVNPGQARASANTAAIAVYGGRGTFGSVTCIDTQRARTMSRGVDVTSPGAAGGMRSLTVSGQREQPFKSVSRRFARPRMRHATRSVHGHQRPRRHAARSRA